VTTRTAKRGVRLLVKSGTALCVIQGTQKLPANWLCAQLVGNLNELLGGESLQERDVIEDILQGDLGHLGLRGSLNFLVVVS